MDREKISRFLEGVNRGLEVSLRRLEAEREYLARLSAHLEPLAGAIDRLRQGGTEIPESDPLVPPA